jgi:hypothetical protein
LALNFGVQILGTTSAAATLTLSNPGTGTLHLAASNVVVITGANPGDFSVVTGTTCINNFGIQRVGTGGFSPGTKVFT